MSENQLTEIESPIYRLKCCCEVLPRSLGSSLSVSLRELVRKQQGTWLHSILNAQRWGQFPLMKRNIDYFIVKVSSSFTSVWSPGKIQYIIVNRVLQRKRLSDVISDSHDTAHRSFDDIWLFPTKTRILPSISTWSSLSLCIPIKAKIEVHYLYGQSDHLRQMPVIPANKCLIIPLQFESSIALVCSPRHQWDNSG